MKRLLALMLGFAMTGCGGDVAFEMTPDPGGDEFGDIHNITSSSAFEWVHVGLELKEDSNWIELVKQLLRKEGQYVKLADRQWADHNRGRDDKFLRYQSLDVAREDGKLLVTVGALFTMPGSEDDPGWVGFVFDGDKCVDVEVVH